MSNISKLQHETFMVGSYGCNCSILYCTQSKEAIVIDPGNDAPVVLKRITALGLKVKWLLHTHAHFDHIGQSSILARQLNAKICLHQGDQFLYDALEQQGTFFGQQVGPAAPIDLYLEDGMNFGMENNQLENIVTTLHTPGHTPGSVCFYSESLESPLLLSGDTLFQRSIGRTDLPGGNHQQIIRSIKDRLCILPEETKVVPGHGPLTTIYSEKKNNPFL